jgi:hypothetical protein
MCPLQELPVWAENANEFLSHYFKTDLVGDLASGSIARGFEVNTFKEC